MFVDLRDRTGIVQVAIGPGAPPEVRRVAGADLASESVVEVEGPVTARPAKMKNPELATGDIEVQATKLAVVGPAATPAIPVARGKGEELPAEELRLKYRHLDLRRPEMQANLMLRHRLLQRARRTLSELEFVEIETPILTKPTPEGARDYLVPSRVHPGEFYALPQSPQIYKQLLMVAGFDRYFQIARCFRDEDLRNDRQPEFTQIDLEASFVGMDDVLGYVEAVLVDLWDEGGHTIARPFPRMTWREAMERYGTDKPDLRYDLPIVDWTAQVKPLGVPFFESALRDGARVRGLAVKGGGALSRKDVDQLADAAKQLGGAGLAWVKRQGEQISGSVGKHFTAEALGGIGVGDGDVGLMTVGPDRVTSPVLHRVRQEVIQRLGPTVPTLGVCLGHQAIVEAFGGEVGQAHTLLHGKSSRISHDGRGVFTGLEEDIEAGRYHSLAAVKVPDELEVTARTADGEVMGVRHRTHPVEGVQFHPESVLTPLGPAMAKNFLEGKR